MLRNNVGKICIFFGLLSLMHSGFSAAQRNLRSITTIISLYLLFTMFILHTDRSYLRLIEQGFDYLPIDIIVQTLLSLIVTTWGVTVIAGDFKEIRATTELENKSFESVGNRPSFYTFSHRGRVLSSVYSQGHL